MSFGGGGGRAYSGGGGVAPDVWKKQQQSASEAQAKKWGYDADTVDTTRPMLSRQVQIGPSANERAMKSMMRTNDANAINSQPFQYQTEWMNNPWYKPADTGGQYETSTTENPATGGSTTTVKRLPQRQPSPRTQQNAAAAAAGSTSLLSASGDGLKSLLGQ